MKILIISIPLTASITLGLVGRYIGIKGGRIISITSIGVSTILSIISLIDILKGRISTIYIKSWFNIGILQNNIEFLYDLESILMNNLISIITMIVIIYSYWYLAEDPHLNRFISYLLLFSVSMFLLVSSSNFLLLFLGWESVGLVSYLLISYWYISPSNNKSALKAFFFNKIGDISFLFSLLLLFFFSSSSSLNLLLQWHPHQRCGSNQHGWLADLGAGLLLPEFYEFNEIYNTSDLIIYKFLLFSFLIAAIAKSAQLFLHPWLGDAMAGPTPVSALLHAATMVTAGIYLIIRTNKISIILDESILTNIKSFIIIIGTLTILFAGFSAFGQYDIKKIIAFSTCAQIGFMFISLYAYLPSYGSLFHLLTHGFFKALLFLSAGLIIHNFFNEQDLRKSGLFSSLSPFFFLLFLIGSLALLPLPPLSGFFSKEIILFHSLLNNNLSLFFFLFLGSLLSSLYSFSLLFFSFFNPSPIPSSLLSKFHPSYPPLFLLSFSVLILGSLFLGSLSFSLLASPYLQLFEIETLLSSSLFFNFLPSPWAGGLFLRSLSSPISLSLFGFLLFSLYLHISKFTKFYHTISSLLSRRFFFDSFYNYFFSLPIFSLSYHFSFKFLDRGFLEFLGPLGFFRFFWSFNQSRWLDSSLPHIYSQNVYNIYSQNVYMGTGNGASGHFYFFIYFLLSFFLLLLFWFLF